MIKASKLTLRSPIGNDKDLQQSSNLKIHNPPSGKANPDRRKYLDKELRTTNSMYDDKEDLAKTTIKKAE